MRLPASREVGAHSNPRTAPSADLVRLRAGPPTLGCARRTASLCARGGGERLAVVCRDLVPLSPPWRSIRDPDCAGLGHRPAHPRALPGRVSADRLDVGAPRLGRGSAGRHSYHAYERRQRQHDGATGAHGRPCQSDRSDGKVTAVFATARYATPNSYVMRRAVPVTGRRPPRSCGEGVGSCRARWSGSGGRGRLDPIVREALFAVWGLPVPRMRARLPERAHRWFALRRPTVGPPGQRCHRRGSSWE
jgi:hypothetical protein